MPTNVELEMLIRKLEARIQILESQHHHGIGVQGAGLNYSGLPMRIKNGQFVALEQKES